MTYTIPAGFKKPTKRQNKRIRFVNTQICCLPNQTATAEQVEQFEKLALMIYPDKKQKCKHQWSTIPAAHFEDYILKCKSCGKIMNPDKSIFLFKPYHL